MSIVETRISQKHDFESNWVLKTDFIPYEGEIIVYDAELDGNGNIFTDAYVKNTKKFPNNRTDAIPHARIKIGDGVTDVNKLKFSSSNFIDENDVLILYCGDSTKLT